MGIQSTFASVRDLTSPIEITVVKVSLEGFFKQPCFGEPVIFTLSTKREARWPLDSLQCSLHMATSIYNCLALLPVYLRAKMKYDERNGETSLYFFNIQHI